MAAFTIRGKNVEVTPALRDYVEKRVGKITKYFENVGEISVLLSVEGKHHKVEVTAPIVRGVLLRGEEHSEAAARRSLWPVATPSAGAPGHPHPTLKYRKRPQMGQGRRDIIWISPPPLGL